MATSNASMVVERARLRRDLQEILDESAAMYAAGHSLAPERFVCCGPLVDRINVLNDQLGDMYGPLATK